MVQQGMDIEATAATYNAMPFPQTTGRVSQGDEGHQAQELHAPY